MWNFSANVNCCFLFALFFFISLNREIFELFFVEFFSLNYVFSFIAWAFLVCEIQKCWLVFEESNCLVLFCSEFTTGKHGALMVENYNNFSRYMCDLLYSVLFSYKFSCKLRAWSICFMAFEYILSKIRSSYININSCEMDS